MKERKRTEFVLILDRSQSMAGLETDTIGGFNGMIEKQRKEEGEVFVTTVLFDDRYELLHDRIPIQDIPTLTKKEYYVRGWTALLDALGKTIINIQKVEENSFLETPSEQVIFVIITDGYENSSKEFSQEMLKRLIEAQKKKGWEFIFLGANIDAPTTAASYGIDPRHAANYHNDAMGVEANFHAINEAVSGFRSQGVLCGEWKRTIDEDYQQRS